MKCQRVGCDRDATHYPCVFVPADGYPAVPPNLIETTVGLELCEDHATEQQVLDNMPQLIKDACNDALRSVGKMPVDWSRARLEPRPLGDEAWLQFTTGRKH